MSKNFDEIVIRYKIKNKNLKLFGKQFVNNNKDKCKLIINGKEQELKEYIYLRKNLLNDTEKEKSENSYESDDSDKSLKKDNSQNINNKKGKNNLRNMEENLLNKKISRDKEKEENEKILEIKLYAYKEINDFSYMFSFCNSLIYISDFSHKKIIK